MAREAVASFVAKARGIVVLRLGPRLYLMASMGKCREAAMKRLASFVVMATGRMSGVREKHLLPVDDAAWGARWGGGWVVRC